MSTPDGQNGFIFSKPHDTTYIQVLAPPESAGPIALFLIVQIPELVAILHETRGELTLQQREKYGEIHPIILSNFEMKAIKIHVLSIHLKKNEKYKINKKNCYFNRFQPIPSSMKKKIPRFAKQKNSPPPWCIECHHPIFQHRSPSCSLSSSQPHVKRPFFFKNRQSF